MREDEAYDRFHDQFENNDTSDEDSIPFEELDSTDVWGNPDADFWTGKTPE
ncbi:hypothetical protein [Marinifilum fragile]|uniref:hypothetical protein n=1 Tax=Marinifilum fragile TaxID=570161 RepID=UPI002AA8615B|nr:hypothetical protein [Marinifilum fragile]